MYEHEIDLTDTNRELRDEVRRHFEDHLTAIPAGSELPKKLICNDKLGKRS